MPEGTFSHGNGQTPSGASGNGDRNGVAATRGQDPPSDLTFERNAFLSMRPMLVAYQLLTATWREILGVNAHEQLVLSHLSEVESLTPGELGRRVNLSNAAMTTLVDRMVKLGYVERHPDHQDRRRVRLSVTPKVLEAVRGPVGSMMGELEDLTSNLSDQEWKVVQGFLADAAKTFDKYASRAGAPVPVKS